MTQYRCIQTKLSPLIKGAIYTRKSINYDTFGCEMWEMSDCPGTLFGPWRFEVVIDDDPLSERAVQEHWAAMFQAVGLPPPK